MIRKPNNWESVQVFSDRPKLPLGAYICTIKKAVIQNNGYGDQLCILFDISAGEFAGYYADDYKANQREDKKWRGVLRQFLPKDDGSDKDEWTKSGLKGLITSIENSNRGYVWNWDETTLSGKEVGIVFRNEEWEYNGKTGWAVRPFRATSVSSIDDCTYTLPKDKPLKDKSTDSFGGYTSPVSAPGNQYSAPASDFSALEDDDSQLPF